MKCTYINLDAEARRRSSVEASFQKHRLPHWSLTRFAAVDGAYVQKHNIPGKVSPAVKACFLSHKQVIEDSLRHDETIFILEDDAVFGERTCQTIEQSLNADLDGLDWDILFTDVGVTANEDLTALVRLRRQAAVGDNVQILDLKSLPSFFGSSAYLLNPKSKRKIHQLLSRMAALDEPYDMLLRRLINQSDIRGFCFFPFITTVSSEADSSCAQLDAIQQSDLIWNAYRRLIWLEGDIDALADTDAWPADEAALQEAIRLTFGLEQRPDAQAMTELAEQWRPWRGVAAHLLREYYQKVTRSQNAPATGQASR